MKAAEKLDLIEQAFLSYYQDGELAPRLREAILYSLQAGGKRIRPLILLELLEGFGLELTLAHGQVAAALEMIHTGSLIHDDLPAMDNDDYRRGRLTNHKVYGEDLAILAGDSLFLDPYGMIAQTDLAAPIKVDLIAALSDAAGSRGMVAGQVLDMEGEGQQLSLEDLKKIHANKTGKLLTYPFLAAGIIAEQESAVLQELVSLGSDLGLAFQIRDDILDVTASFEELGKTPKKDLLADKSTYTALLGLEESKRILDQLLNQVISGFANLPAFESPAIEEIVGRLRIHD